LSYRIGYSGIEVFFPAGVLEFFGTNNLIMKNSITTPSELQNHISLMNKRSRLLEESISGKVHNIREGLKPVNLIKNTFSSLGSGIKTKKNLVNATVGVGLGFLAYRMIAGKTPNILKKTTARAVQLGVTSFMARRLNFWRMFAQNFLAKRRMRRNA
jgi:hypothetical protein